VTEPRTADITHHHTAQGELFIDECFASIRGPGEAIGIHSGQGTSQRNQSFYHNNRFYNGQVDMLLALTDIGKGDGGTMLIPGAAWLDHHARCKHYSLA
jgi:hypothetical protein